MPLTTEDLLVPTDTRSTTLTAYIYATSTTPQGVTTVTQSGPRTVGTESDTRTYVQSRKRPIGFVNPKAYTRTIQRGASLACIPFFASGRSNGSNVSMQTGLSVSAASGRLLVPSFDGGLANRALVDAKLKLKDQKVNFGVAFAERAKTAELVANNISRIARAYRDVRKGHFRSAANHLGISPPGKWKRRDGSQPRDSHALHGAWLEAQYGWKPLLSDAYGAAESLREKDRKGSTRYGCTVKSRKSARSVETKEGGVVSEVNHPLLFKQRMVTDFGAFVRLDYYRSSPALAALAQVGFTNPLLIAWELVPFSFVVDWVAPIGNYLSILDAELGWTFKAGSLSTRQVTKRQGSISPRPITGWDRLSASGYHNHVYKRVDRSPYVTSPVPGFSFKSPASGLHLANAIALLANAVR